MSKQEKAERTMRRRASKRMVDSAPCMYCGQHLWQHPRCTECTRFIWCRAADRTGLAHLVCPVH
jgi:hypothetical protein